MNAPLIQNHEFTSKNIPALLLELVVSIPFIITSIVFAVITIKRVIAYSNTSSKGEALKGKIVGYREKENTSEDLQSRIAEILVDKPEGQTLILQDTKCKIENYKVNSNVNLKLYQESRKITPTSYEV